MRPTEPTHLLHRDRLALAFRIVGALTGLAVIGYAFATSSWDKAWVRALFVLATVGGAVAYHLLTSIVSCPACGDRVFNFRVGPAESRHKHFRCRRCGTTAWLAEGFYWQSDING